MPASITQAVIGSSPTSDNGVNTTTPSATFPVTPTNGHLLIASVVTFSATITPPAGWTELPTVDGPNPLTFITIWVGYRYKQAGDSNIVTFTLSAAQACLIGLREVAGPVVSSPLDVGGMLNSFEGSPYIVTSGSGTAAATNELLLLDIFSDVGNQTSNSFSTPAGLTQDAFAGITDGVSTSAGLALYHGTNGSTAIPAQTVTQTVSGFGNADLLATQYLIKPFVGVTQNIARTDTGATVADTLSMAQLPTPTNPDQASADRAAFISDNVLVQVLKGGGGSPTYQHVTLFRRGNFL